MASTSNAITHLYDTYEQATSVVHDLESAGVPSSDISIISQDRSGTDGETSGAATGAGVGTALGAGAGLLAGLGIMAIPGIGPVVAAGWLASTAVGAVAGLAAGGIIGALTDIGVSEDEAHVYAEGVRRGGTLVSVRSVAIPRSSIAGIMNKYSPVDPANRGADYRNEGWNRFEDRVDQLADKDRNISNR